MSGPGTSEQFVITADTRRRWSREEKRAIIEEAARTTISVSAVARRHGIAPSLLFRWRRDFAEAARVVAPAFIPLALPAPAEATDRDRCRRLCATAELRCGSIEIDLAGGRRLRVDGTVHPRSEAGDRRAGGWMTRFPPAGGCSGRRGDRYAQGLQRPVDAGAGSSATRSVLGPGLRVPRPARRPDQDIVVGRPGPVLFAKRLEKGRLCGQARHDRALLC